MKNIAQFNENLSHYKNYFTTKAIGHTSASSIKDALDGLQILKNQVYLASGGEGYLLVDTKIVDTLTFNVLNYKGEKDKIEKVKSASMYQIDDTSNTKDLTSSF